MLSQACVHGHLEVVKYLLKQQPDIHWDKDDALMKSIEGDNIEVVKYLVSKGADIYSRDDDAFRLAAK
jgi:ankyrin repeat protein